MGQIAEISLVQNDPPLIFKQSLLIISQKHYLTLIRGRTPPNMKKKANSEVQHVEISLVQNDPPLIFKQSLLIIGQKPYLTTYQGGPPPPKMEKYQILRSNTSKFR